uniref:Enkurin domain-containing protein n=1 Tax=Ascaris lumbricoides TaxID=6252 RepID=A0A0M3HN00_ASCLU
MSHSIGVHVFPTRISEKIRASPALLHYQMPTKQPSIDYETICDHSKLNECFEMAPYNDLKIGSSQSQSETRVLTTTCDHSMRQRDRNEKFRTRDEQLQSQTTQLSAPISIYERQIIDDNESNAVGMKILHDLDNALEEDEQMSLEEIKQKVKRMNLTFREYTSEPPEFMEPPTDYDDYTYGDELKKMPDGINSLAHYKEEKRKEIADRENQVRCEVEKLKKEITAEKFIDQTPVYFKGTETEIPHWKRLLIAQKIAAEAIRQQEAVLWVGPFMPGSRHYCLLLCGNIGGGGGGGGDGRRVEGDDLKI